MPICTFRIRRLRDSLLPWLVLSVGSSCAAPSDEPTTELVAELSSPAITRPQLVKVLPALVRAGQFTIDGRLLVTRPSAIDDDGDELTAEWVVQPLRPDLLSTDGLTPPRIEAALPGPTKALAGRVDDPSVRQGVHYGVAIDPAFGPRPLRVPSIAACDNAPTNLGFGAFECYRLVIHAHFVSLSGGKALRTARAVVVVRAFDATTGLRARVPQIVKAQFLPWAGYPFTFRPITANGAGLDGFEMSTTGDGRLIVFDSFGGRGHHFTFNPNPVNAVDQWTVPQPLSALVNEQNTKFCLIPGRSVAACPADQVTTFGERYPIARAKIRMGDGTEVPPGKPFLCLYPWIDFDGANIFCGMISPRDMASMFGRDTGNIVRLMDGPFNPVPATSDCGADPDAVIKAHKPCPGNTRSNGLGRTTGMWSLFSDHPHRSLPFYDYDTATAMLLKVADGYAVYDEISSDDFDPDNLLYLHMTPTITWVDGLKDGKNTNQVLEDRTPDTSGRFHTTLLRTPAKVQFATGYFDSLSADSPQLAVPPGRSVKRLPDPWLGEALFFRPGGVAEVTSVAGDDSLDVARPAFSISVAVMPMSGAFAWLAAQGARELQLLAKGNGWRVSLLGDGRVQARLRLSSGVVTLQSPRSLAEQQWAHLAVTLGRETRNAPSRVRLYLDGEMVAAKNARVGDVLTTSTEPLLLGNELGGTGDALVQLDSLRVSKIELTLPELAREAYRRLRPAHAPAVTGLPAPLDAAPLGLDLRAANLPNELVPWLTGPSRPRWPALLALGDRLFESELLSQRSARTPHRDRSCASCHLPGQVFTDGRPLGSGRRGDLPRHTPTLINRMWGTAQFWDGRSTTLVAQALDPIDNPEELDGNRTEILAALETESDAGRTWRSRFEDAFALGRAPITMNHVALALAAYQLTLLRGNAAADRIALDGSDATVSRGRELFFGKARCVSCHSGSNFSDEGFHVTGVGGGDPGRGAVSGRTVDRRAFKTPTLRHVVDSGPYFHDGSGATLREVIEFYNRGGGEVPADILKSPELAPLHLTADEQADLLAFLRAL
jgi:cytochrome c peroxidase